MTAAAALVASRGLESNIDIKVEKTCSHIFKAVTRERREKVQSGKIANNEIMPHVGKYTPKYNIINS